MLRSFVIRPFGVKKDGAGREIDFERVHRELIGPALAAAGVEGGTTGDIVEPGNIREDMFALLFEADLVVCDVTVHNANVFYELGIRHALRKGRTVLIKGRPSSDSPPFDLLTDRYLAYDLDALGGAVAKLTETIQAAVHSDRPTDSPVFRLLSSLPEADPKTVQAVPLDFREEVDRARAARSKGWLRLLAGEVRGQRFQWAGLELIGAAQWKLEDYAGARESYEAIREVRPGDGPANLALASIYERLHRKSGRPELLEASDQALARVLAGTQATPADRIEALTLQGRNEKTRWRQGIEPLGTVEARRQAAPTPGLLRSYEAYRQAFQADLNHYYAGLAALQQAVILDSLAVEPTWPDAFADDAAAAKYREAIADAGRRLAVVVDESIAAALADPAAPGRRWAEISRADASFLRPDSRDARVVQAYRGAFETPSPFDWDATRRQLELFAALGIRADLARRVIAEIDPLQGPVPTRAVHVVVVAGHRVDRPGRAQRRFPPEAEERARALLRERIQRLLAPDHDTVGLASAAPGTDLLAHEVLADLGARSVICLPMPRQEFARLAFDDLDPWRTRFLDLAGRRDARLLELADRPDLPRWLHGARADPWERGNRWVVEMARTWGAERVTLVALWDGQPEGDGPGGTAHLVTLARNTGTMHVDVIDAGQLLA